MSCKTNTKQIYFFTLPPALGDSVDEVVCMDFGGQSTVAVWHLFVCVAAIVFSGLIAFSQDDFCAALFTVICFAFVWFGCAIGAEKCGAKAKKIESSIVASIAAAAEAEIAQSIKTLVVISTAKVLLPRLEWRASSPEKIQSPTLFPRLVAAPWLVRA